jgi:hypothetical protein
MEGSIVEVGKGRNLVDLYVNLEEKLHSKYTCTDVSTIFISSTISE